MYITVHLAESGVLECKPFLIWLPVRNITQNLVDSVKLLFCFFPLHAEKPNLRAHRTGLDQIKHFQTVGVWVCVRVENTVAMQSVTKHIIVCRLTLTIT